FHVVLPQAPLSHIRSAELPVLAGIVQALQEALALLALRNVQKKFDGPRAVPMQMLFQVRNRTIAVLPEILVLSQLFRQSLGLQDLGVNPNDQNLFVIRTVEDTDAAALGQAQCGAPEEVMFQFFGAGMLKAEDLAALRVHA